MGFDINEGDLHAHVVLSSKGPLHSVLLWGALLLESIWGASLGGLPGSGLDCPRLLLTGK